jgi:hypothetical protein
LCIQNSNLLYDVSACSDRGSYDLPSGCLEVCQLLAHKLNSFHTACTSTKSAMKIDMNSVPIDLRWGISHKYFVDITDGVISRGPMSSFKASKLFWAGPGCAFAFIFIISVKFLVKNCNVSASARIFGRAKGCPRSTRIVEKMDLASPSAGSHTFRRSITFESFPAASSDGFPPNAYVTAPVLPQYVLLRKRESTVQKSGSLISCRSFRKKSTKSRC